MSEGRNSRVSYWLPTYTNRFYKISSSNVWRKIRPVFVSYLDEVESGPTPLSPSEAFEPLDPQLWRLIGEGCFSPSTEASPVPGGNAPASLDTFGEATPLWAQAPRKA